MPRVTLTSGAYQAESIISSAQRCINLFVEYLPKSTGEPSPATHYPTPGLTLLTRLPNAGPVRGIYLASNNDLYVVSGANLYYVSPAWVAASIAVLTTSTGPVSMVDNTLTLVVVDGSLRNDDPASLTGGVQVDLPTRVATPMPTTDNGFFGADKVIFLSTFLLFNKPGTPQFYVSDSLAVTFTALFFANKTASQDWLQTIDTARGEVWLLGSQFSSEIWTLSGAPDFPFQSLPGVLVENACIAKYSVAKGDGQLFWLAANKDGRSIVVRASGYEATRISTHAIEVAIRGYEPSDAIGFCYQVNGHVFYVLTFPTNDVTWVFDEATEQWHEWAWTDPAGPPGNLHRHRANCATYGYFLNLCGDWENSNLYAIDPSAILDNGAPITHIRSFPHEMNDGKRLVFTQFIADMECGNMDQGGNTGFVNLRWSDDRGASYSNPLTASMGTTLTSLSFRRLGMSRDRVWELSWSGDVKTALNGAFVEYTPSAT